MDISKRKFKTIEGVDSIAVWVEVPRYKTKGMLWWKKAYYDEADLIWAPVSRSGGLIMESRPEAPATFPNISAAREFIKKIQAPKKEVIIEAAETKVIDMTTLKKNSHGKQAN